MAQHDYNVSNQSFPSFRQDLNNALSAIQTTNSGTSRPTGAVAGQIWLDTTSATTPTLKFFDGADDISLATINYTANTVDWLDSSVTITGLSTTATGTVLTLTDSAHTTSVNMICGNNTALRFNELTANGSNYIGLKAPASLSADLTFTLPSTDGTSGQFLKTDGAGNLSFATAGLTGATSTATGTVLTLSDTQNVASVNVILDNQKELRFRETTANGTNYVGLKAPASLSADLTYTLPSADGTSGQVLQTNGSGVLSFSSPSSDYVRLVTSTITSSVSEVNFTTGFSDTYKIYELEFMNVDISAVDHIFFRWAYGGTPTYLTSGYIDFSIGFSGLNSSTFAGKNTYNRTTAHSITAGDHTVGNTTGYTVNGKIRLFNCRSTSTYFKGFNSQVIYLHSGVDFGTSAHTCGFNSDTTLRDSAVTGFKLYTGSGNFDGGTFILYGIKTS